MDLVGSAINIANKASEVYGDYERGKQVRLGQYRGTENIKQIGHYNKKGKLLGIYHG